MSSFGIPKKAPFQRLRADEWNAVVDALDKLNSMINDLQNDLTSGNFTPYFYSVKTANGAQFGDEIYVKGLKVLHDQDPIYISKFLDDAVSQIQNLITNYLANIQNATNSLSQILSKINAYLSPTGITSLSLSVSTNPQPLVSNSTPIKRAIIYVTNDSQSPVYIGDANNQLFPIQPGQMITIEVCDASKIYLKSDSTATVKVLLELTSQSTCS